MAPNRSTSTRSPLGRVAMTRELSSESSTWGVGTEGETGIAEGLLARSTIFPFLFWNGFGLVWFGFGEFLCVGF